jgi:hypothetical protein
MIATRPPMSYLARAPALKSVRESGRPAVCSPTCEPIAQLGNTIEMVFPQM